jgi:hypothetical protein
MALLTSIRVEKRWSWKGEFPDNSDVAPFTVNETRLGRSELPQFSSPTARSNFRHRERLQLVTSSISCALRVPLWFQRRENIHDLICCRHLLPGSCFYITLLLWAMNSNQRELCGRAAEVQCVVQPQLSISLQSHGPMSRFGPLLFGRQSSPLFSLARNPDDPSSKRMTKTRRRRFLDGECPDGGRGRLCCDCFQ